MWGYLEYCERRGRTMKFLYASREGARGGGEGGWRGEEISWSVRETLDFAWGFLLMLMNMLNVLSTLLCSRP